MPDPNEPDLEEDWQALGKPTAAQLAWQEFQQNFGKNVMDLVNRFFAWLDDVLKFPFRLVGAIVQWFTNPDHFFGALIGGVILFLVIGGCWCAREAVRASETVTHCSISLEAPETRGGDPAKDVHVLTGHRSWRPDSKIRRSTDFKQLQETASELGCPLR